jgi:hypothetical protein
MTAAARQRPISTTDRQAPDGGGTDLGLMALGNALVTRACGAKLAQKREAD